MSKSSTPLCVVGSKHWRPQMTIRGSSMKFSQRFIEMAANTQFLQATRLVLSWPSIALAKLVASWPRLAPGCHKSPGTVAKPLVIIESPFREDAVYRDTGTSNKRYLQACIRDSLKRGEAPFASHQMYTQALDDDDALDRQLGISAGFEWHCAADYVVVYADRGVSSGMEAGIRNASRLGLDVYYRRLGGIWAMSKPLSSSSDSASSQSLSSGTRTNE